MAPDPVCPEQLKLSHRAIGRGLNLDRRAIDKYVPSEARITSTTGSETIEHDDGDNGDHNGYDHEPLEADYTLESSILRLRQLERTCSRALAEALRQDKTGECVVLRRDLTNNLRSLNVAFDQQLKRDTVRGRLVPTEVAISMIDAGVREALMVIRRLPDSARDQQEKEKAEAFVFAVNDAMKHGANAARAIARSRGYACPPS
jgi:hypothetical protein